MAKRSTSDQYEISAPETLEVKREDLRKLYYYMKLNRRLDERLGILYRQNHVVGGLYSSLGEEATSVGSAYALDGGVESLRQTGKAFAAVARELQAQPA